MRFNINYNKQMPHLPNVDSVADRFFSRGEFELLAVDRGLTFDQNVQPNLPSGQWAFVSPFQSQDRWVFDVNSVQRKDVNHPSIKKLLATNPMPTSWQLIRGSATCAVQLNRQGSWKWQDGPYTTTNGDTVTVSGSGFSSLVSWCRQSPFSKTDEDDLLWLLRNPFELKKRVTVPHSIVP